MTVYLAIITTVLVVTQHSTCCLEHDGEKCPCLFDEEVENNGRA